MASNSSAVFNEVLSLNVDSSQFAAELAKVEAIYEASLVRMQRAAESTDIAGGLSQQATTAATAWERFGEQFERQMLRIPARMAAMAIVTAAIAPVISAIAELVIGFRNLEQHSPDFTKTETSLKALNTEIASVAATPVFNLILEQMKALGDWLTKNKVYADNLVLSLGNVATSVIAALIEFAKTDVVKTVFKGVGVLFNDLAFAVGTVVNEITTLFNLITAKGSDQSPWQHFVDTLKHPLGNGDFWGTQARAAKDGIGAILDAGGDAQLQLQKNWQNLQDSLAGTANQEIPNVPTGEQRTLAEMKKEFQDKLSAVKDYYAEVSAVIKNSVAEGVISRQAAAPILKSYLDDEQKQINGLVEAYKNLATTAKDAIGKPEKQTAAQHGYDKIGNDARKALLLQGLADEKAASEESIANAKILSDAELKISNETAKARLAIVKKEVSDGSLTRQQGIAAEEAEEARRYQAAINEISNRAGAPDSEAATRRQVALLEENTQHQNTLNALTSQHAEAIKADTDAIDAHNAAMTKVREAYISANLETAKALGNKQRERDITRELIALKLQEAEAELAINRNKLDSAKADGESDDSKEVMNLRLKIAQDQALIHQLQEQQNRAQGSGSDLGKTLNGNTQSPGTELSQSLGLDRVKQDFEDAAAQTDATTRALGEFAAGLEGAVGVMKGLTDAVDGAVAGYHKAGAMGAASSLLQNSNVENTLGSIAGMASRSLGQMVPVVGPMIGQMFSAITGLFQAGIQAMVQTIQEQVQAINLAAQTKQIGIQQQIQELRQEEQNAISALGGKKKAGAQLHSILNQLNAEIAQLQYQAQQTVQQFNDMVAAARTGTAAGNAVASQWLSTWEQVNQQVEAYVQAGGSLATAAEYLNQQLLQQRQALVSQLNQGNQQAIRDALQLNQLEQQKVDMMRQEAATEFGMLNSDSLERRTASAVATGVALTNQRHQYAQQLLDLNNQITAEQLKVAAESKVFDLNQSIAALQNNQNALNIAALDQQLNSYKEMQAIILATNGLTFNAGNINPGWGLNGTQAPIPGLPGVAGPTIGTMNITINGDATAGNVDSLGKAIVSNMRSGRTTFSVGAA